MGRNKYGAVRTKIDGINFPSKLEAAVYLQIKLFITCGQLLLIKTQAGVQLTPSLRWKIDFKVFDFKLERDKFIEAKGREDANFLNKIRVFYDTQESHVEVYEGNWSNPKLSYVVIGQRLSEEAQAEIRKAYSSRVRECTFGPSGRRTFRALGDTPLNRA